MAKTLKTNRQTIVQKPGNRYNSVGLTWIVSVYWSVFSNREMLLC